MDLFQFCSTYWELVLALLVVPTISNGLARIWWFNHRDDRPLSREERYKNPARGEVLFGLQATFLTIGVLAMVGARLY